jgi:nucleoside-diphosphate-sugar epimerase
MKKSVLNLLVVGGTGFLGFHILKEAKKRNIFNCSSISKSKPSISRKIEGVKYIICDVTNGKKLRKVISKNSFDYVINLSGYVDHSKSKIITKTHFFGSKNLIDIFKNKNLSSFIHIGTSLEYGNAKSPHNESLKCHPKTKYAKAKYKTNKYLQHCFDKYNFPFTTLRLYQVYGPNQLSNRLIPFIISQCLKDKKFPCTNGNQLRDFLYVDDFVNLIFRIFNSTKARGKIYNVGYGKPLKVKVVINYIVKMIKKGRPEFGKIKMRDDEVRVVFPDISKIKSELNWNIKNNYLEGLKKTINYYIK